MISWIRAVEVCAVCFQAAASSSRMAYYGTTVFLLVLPLLLLGILIFWVARAMRRGADENDAGR